MSALLRFENVSCRRGGRLLFEGMSMEIGPGDAVHVAGPNGSGKSSLIRLAAGLLPSTSGSIEASSLALADDNLALDRELPLRRTLSFWGGDAEAALQALGLERLRDVPVRLLSSGQRKRATLARVAASGARLWLLDEPLNGLDSNSTGDLEELLTRHRSAGGAVLAASHVQLPGEWRRLELRP